MAEARTVLQKVMEHAVQFVVAQKGAWDHDAWEKFAERVAKLGTAMDDEGKRNLGNILEGCKFFYHSAPPPAKKKPLAKK